MYPTVHLNTIARLLILILLFSLCGCGGGEEDLEANSEYGKEEQIKVIKFYADWCPPCKAMEPEFEKIKIIYQHITFEEVDYDQDKATIDAYNVQSIPAVVKIKNGKEVDRKMGYMSRNDLVKFVENI